MKGKKWASCILGPAGLGSHAVAQMRSFLAGGVTHYPWAQKDTSARQALVRGVLARRVNAAWEPGGVAHLLRAPHQVGQRGVSQAVQGLQYRGQGWLLGSRTTFAGICGLSTQRRHCNLAMQCSC